MKTKLLGVCLSVALVGLTAQASATSISITMTGQMFGGGDNGGLYNGGVIDGPFTGQPFTLDYLFDTSLATPGNYTNTGSSSSLSGSSSGSCLGCISSVVGYVTGTFSVFPGIYTCCGGSSFESDSATKGSTSQTVYDNSGIYHGPFGSVSTYLINPAIPGNITAPYYLSGPDIGGGSFLIGEGTLGGAYGGLQIETLTANGATPLPATLPLFAGGLGVIGLLGWRKKRKQHTQVAA